MHNLFNFSSLNLLGCRLFFSLFPVIPESIIPNEILPLSINKKGGFLLIKRSGKSKYSTGVGH
ncbi:hypothetical protein EAO28_13500 [Klebsiella pneumoniae]|uniref:Uncharacterized protein n=1 Tax=Klebsiella pneumoniae TaxID=573 RepID=A0A3P2EGR0_KLEPN|nr:hypothetical protein EAO28_13500 [Klebsiella pneumoniae]